MTKLLEATAYYIAKLLGIHNILHGLVAESSNSDARPNCWKGQTMLHGQTGL